MTSVKHRFWAAAIAAMMSASAAYAANEITVVVTGTGGGRPATILFDATEAINAANGLPTIETTDSRVNIYSTSTLAAAGRVTFVAAAGTRTSDLELFIGTGAFPTTQDPLTPRLTDWAGIAALPTNLVAKVKLAGAISGDLTNPGGSDKSFSVKEVFRLEVGDEIQGPVEATGSGTAIERMIFGKNLSAGTITATNGNIGQLDATASPTSIAGAISALNGSITDILSTGDIIISASPGIAAQDGIIGIFGDDIDAEIVTNANSGSGGIYCLEATGDLDGSLQTEEIDNIAIAPIRVDGDLFADLVIEGDCSGDIVVVGSFLGGSVTIGDDYFGYIISENIVSGVSIGGNFDGVILTPLLGNIDIEGDAFGVISCEEFETNYLVRIGGSFYCDVEITEADRFDGQFIIGAANPGGEEWDAVFDACGQELSPLPFYEQPGTFGLGAVGLVPFHRHPNDSIPAEDEYVDSVPTETWPSSPTTRETIVIRFYGPVFDFNPDGNLPLRVYQQDVSCGSPPCSWVEITSSCTVLVNPNGDARTVWVCMTPSGGAVPFDAFYNYRVEPRISGGVSDLRSDDTGLGTAPNVYEFSHYFSVWPMSRPAP